MDLEAEQGMEEETKRQPPPHAPHRPASDSRKAGAEAAEDHLGPSSEGDTAPDTSLVTGRGSAHAHYDSRIPPGFSLVINDVDAEGGEGRGAREVPYSGLPHSEFGVEVVVALECEQPDNIEAPEEEKEVVSCRRVTLTHSSSQKELSDARIKQIQGEVESRKNEFARLLEEHAQVVKQLKAMEEEDGGERLGRQQLH